LLFLLALSSSSQFFLELRKREVLIKEDLEGLATPVPE